MSENYTVRDMRTRFSWCDSNALRTLFEKYDGVEKRNLITVYMALILKVSYNNFENEFLITNKDICEFTGISKDSIAKLMRTLEDEKLIHSEIARDKKGFVWGKEIVLLDYTKANSTGSENTGTSNFLKLNNYTTYNKRSILSNDNINNTKEEVSYDTIEISDEIKETPIETSTNSRDKKKPRIAREIYDQFSDIIDYAADNKILSRPAIVEDGDFYIVPKYITYAIQKLIRLQNEEFVSVYHVEGKNLNQRDWRAEVYRALDNLKIMKEDVRVWPTNKNTLPRDINIFLYNDRTNFSFFIKCLEETTTQKEDLVKEKYGDLVTEEYLKPFRKWFDDSFYKLSYDGEVNLIRNMGELLTLHQGLWKMYGVYYTKLNKWSSYLGTSKPDQFLAFYLKFLRDRNFTARESSLRPSSSAFSAFTTFLNKEYGIDILQDEKEYAKFIERATPKKKTSVPVSSAPIDLSLDSLVSQVKSADDIQKEMEELTKKDY